MKDNELPYSSPSLPIINSFSNNDNTIDENQLHLQSPPPPPPPPPPVTLESITDQTLQFLSTASNETIGACLLGLTATTYVLLGRVGLVLIGVVGGVVLHASWEGGGGAGGGTNGHRGAIGNAHITSNALIRRKLVQAQNVEKVELVASSTLLHYNNLPLETAKALDGITEAVIKDYVKYWYAPILPSELSFPTAIQQSFTAFVLSISNHLIRKRPVDMFLEFTTQSSSILILFFNDLAIAVNTFPELQTLDAIQAYLETESDSNLAFMVNPTHQLKELDLVADDLLEAFLEHKALNCEAVRVFLREIISKIILNTTIQQCSTAEFINEWIVYLLDDEVTSTSPTQQNAAQQRHKRVVSKAQEAMDEAVREAARQSQMIAEQDQDRSPPKAPPQQEFTLFNASITITSLDESNSPQSQSGMRNKPNNTEYLIQLEPANSHYPGWMIVRRLKDFEDMHESLYKAARVSGAENWAKAHEKLPAWRGMSKPKYKDELERYLGDAVASLNLADCVFLRKFLEKDVSVIKPLSKSSFPLAAIENVGKGVNGVFSQATKGVIGGVSGVFNNQKPKKTSLDLSRESSASSAFAFASTATTTTARISQDSINAAWLSEHIPALGEDQILSLPPRPDTIDNYSDDYSDMSRTSVTILPSTAASSSSLSIPEEDENEAELEKESGLGSSKHKPLSENETQRSIELGFSCITELYKLSSAWSVRMAILNAAKSIVLRPGNAQLDSIRQLLQTTVLDPWACDHGVATLLNKIRENALPSTPFPPVQQRSPDQCEDLRRRARKLLVEKGMPGALNNVMGIVAGGEALGRVFDAIQVGKVARGFVFEMLLQAMKGIIN